MKLFKLKIFLLLGVLSFSSCEEYLDIAPESVLTEEVVFSTFNNVQGFVEEMHHLIVSYGTAGHSFQDYVLGDDNFTVQTATFKTSVQFDRGELDKWTRNSLSYLGKLTRHGPNASRPIGLTNTADPRARPSVWRASMQGIRKANLIIQNEDLMVGLSQEEKNVVLGQAYFFRAFFHNEIMKFWGRFPYITEVFTGTISTPRPETYKEAALAANEDYKKAIELLPVDWDNESYGKRTIGSNALRITKGAAYAFQGKNLLLAASPLMFFNNAPNINTYSYDTELASMAADAFAEVLKLKDAGEYSLAPDMEAYKTVFWDNDRNTVPGLALNAKELIFSAPEQSNQGTTISFMATGIPRAIAGTGTQGTNITHNFIHNNFGMANGLSIEDDQSGLYGAPTYDPLRPFDNRDPRLYEWVFTDRSVLSTRATVAANTRTMQLYHDEAGASGFHRNKNGFSFTGYMFKKFYPEIDGEYHVNNGHNIIRQFVGMRIHMRLTDVYLMYAEALHAAKGATTGSSSYSLTAEQAINAIRARAGIPNVNAQIVANKNKFMDEVRRERSVELSWEAHRWLDIRRWGVAHEDKYRIKTGLNFDKDWTFFQETVLVDRVCEYPKHYWLPFEPNQTQFYEGFPQNPGW